MALLEGNGWKIQGISGLILDKDGTLIDSHLYWGEIVQRRAKAASEFYGITPSAHKVLCGFMGYDTETERLLPEGPVALVSRQEVIKALLDGLRSMRVVPSEEDLGNIFNRVMDDFNKNLMSYILVLPGAEDLLRDAKAAGLKLALVTSDSAVSAGKILRHTGLDKYFDSIVGRETTTEDKSTGVPALKALSDMGLTRDAVVAIGDSPVDAGMSAKAGLKTAVLVASGQLPIEKLKRYSKYVSESLTGIKVLKGDYEN
ncbi:MAG: HAD family hydrolase [Elusimicrobiales bacterium]|nr:HAD family hydrolase [Elusimicrobiales bacterium]